MQNINKLKRKLKDFSKKFKKICRAFLRNKKILLPNIGNCQIILLQILLTAFMKKKIIKYTYITFIKN